MLQTQNDNFDMEKIVHKYGFPVRIEDLRTTYKYNCSIEEVAAFEDKLVETSQNNNDFNIIADLIIKNSKFFDKEIFLLEVASLIEKEDDADDKVRKRLEKIDVSLSKVEFEKLLNQDLSIDNILINRLISSGMRQNLAFKEISTIKSMIFLAVWLPPKNTRTKKALVISAKKQLSDSDVLKLTFSKSGEMNVLSSQEFSGNYSYFAEMGTYAIDQLERIEKTLGFENILDNLRPTDLIDFCRYPNLGNMLAIKLLKHNNQNMSTAKGRTFSWDEFYDTVRSNLAYINLDKMLLLSNQMLLEAYMLDSETLNENKIKKLEDFTSKVEKQIITKKLSMFSHNLNKRIKFTDIKEKVKALKKGFINGRFYTSEEVNNLVQELIYEKRSIEEITPEEFKNTLSLSIAEIGLLVRYNKSALEYLLKNKLLKPEELDQVLGYQESFSNEQLLAIMNHGIFSNEKVLQYYSAGSISLESFSYLKNNMDKPEELEQLVDLETLVGLYLNEKQKKEFNKYRKLYKLLKIDGKTIDEKNDVSMKILDQSLELLKDEKLVELYHIGLVSLDVIVNFIQTSELLKKMYLNGYLKPFDVHRLYKNNRINKDMIKEILADKTIEAGQKLILIYSTFPNIEDKGIRIEMLDYLEKVKNENKNGKSKENSNTSDEKFSDKINVFDELYKKGAYDPCSRWRLITTLDNEYSQTYLKDGYAVFYLPNREKYIIEKLYRKNMQFAVGAATYILDEEVFRANEYRIIIDEKIDRSFLVDLYNTTKEKSKVAKIIHTGWDNALCKYFRIDEESKYTDKQRQEIKKLA